MSTQSPTIPEGLDVIQTPNGAIIRRKWLAWTVIPLAIFAVAWDSFLAFWYHTALTSKKVIWIMVVFPIGHLAVGFGITYFVIATLLNKTDVIVTLSGVRVRTYPAPWPGNKNISASEITGVLVRDRTAYGYQNDFRNNRRASFAVMYVDQSRKERRLLSCAQPDQAEFIANAIRAALDLKPQDS